MLDFIVRRLIAIIGAIPATISGNTNVHTALVIGGSVIVAVERYLQGQAVIAAKAAGK